MDLREDAGLTQQVRGIRGNIDPHGRQAAGIVVVRQSKRKTFPSEREDLLEPCPFGNAGIGRDAIGKGVFNQGRDEAIARGEPLMSLQSARQAEARYFANCRAGGRYAIAQIGEDGIKDVRPVGLEQTGRAGMLAGFIGNDDIEIISGSPALAAASANTSWIRTSSLT